MMARFGDLPYELRYRCIRIAVRAAFQVRIARLERLWRPPLFFSTRGGFLDSIGVHHAVVLDSSNSVLHHFYAITHYLGPPHAHMGAVGFEPAQFMHRYDFRKDAELLWYIDMYPHLLSGCCFQSRFVRCEHCLSAPRLRKQDVERFDRPTVSCVRSHRVGYAIHGFQID
jgi:hypothetical protein